MNTDVWEPYKHLLGAEVVEQLYQMAALVQGIKIVHVSSTSVGGGVAEILSKMVPLTNALGIETKWEVLEGTEEFFQCTKTFHNLLQGFKENRPTPAMLKTFEEVNQRNADKLRPLLQEATIVFIHDPQPLALISHFPERKGKWIWRCHIDCSSPDRILWRYLRRFIEKFDASIFSLADFTKPLSHPIYLIPPSIDPLSDKNIELDIEEIKETFKSFSIDIERPTVLQVSRFDRFKDPLGVISAYRLAKKFYPSLQLILAGGSAPDDPEGAKVLEEVLNTSADDLNIHTLSLPPNAPRIINALQRGADIVLQKSTREGFGLTVTEALWKTKPVIGGNTGGIRLQVINHYTGFLVNTPEGAAHRIRYLLQNPQKIKELGINGKKLVKENFLIPRHLREYLTVVAALLFPGNGRIDLSRSHGTFE